MVADLLANGGCYLQAGDCGGHCRFPFRVACFAGEVACDGVILQLSGSVSIGLRNNFRNF